MKTIIQIILVAFFCVSAIHLSGQKENKPSRIHVVELSDGTTLIGNLLAYSEGKPVLVKMGDGEIISIPYSSVIEIKYSKKRFKKYTIKDSEHKALIFNNRKVHYDLSVGLTDDSRKELRPQDIFLEANAHYYFEEWLGVGLHSGFMTYDHSRSFVPVAISAQGYILNKSISPYYSLNIGYGISTTPMIEDEWWMEHHKGGFYMYPKIGVRLSNDHAVNALIFTGFKIQKYTGRFDTCGFEGDCFNTTIQNRTYKRAVIGIGIVF